MTDDVHGSTLLHPGVLRGGGEWVAGGRALCLQPEMVPKALNSALLLKSTWGRGSRKLKLLMEEHSLEGLFG